MEETNVKAIIIGAILLVAIFAAACTTTEPSPVLKGVQAQLYKSPNCGCCGIYSQYAKKEGLSVTIKEMADLSSIKDQYNIPAELRSCHTTIIGEYFVEGHVPAEAIEKLLTEKPDIAGIALPGMPSGTPGMPGPKTEPWVIHAIHKDGTITEFMRL